MQRAREKERQRKRKRELETEESGRQEMTKYNGDTRDIQPRTQPRRHSDKDTSTKTVIENNIAGSEEFQNVGNKRERETQIRQEKG